MDQVLNFLLFDKHEYTYTWNVLAILVNILMLLVYVTFPVPQDLIEKINSYSHRKAFQRDLLLTGF